MSSQFDENVMTEDDKAGKGKFRWSSWIVVALILSPMIAAYVVFSTGIGVPKGTINKGNLLSPATSINDISTHFEGGKPFLLSQNKKRWRMIIVGDNACNQVCQNQLYLSRQVHIRLGEKASRVERVFLNTSTHYDQAFLENLKTEHPRLILAHVNESDWQQKFKDTSASDLLLKGEHIYVVDQEGFAMMSYDDTHVGGDLLADIKRLLKYSYEG